MKVLCEEDGAVCRQVQGGTGWQVGWYEWKLERAVRAVAVIQGRGDEVRVGDRVGAVGMERSGSCRDTAEEVTGVLGPGINQM